MKNQRGLVIHSSSGSTTRQMSFPQFLQFPRRIRSLPLISAVSRRIVTEPRHLRQKTLSRIFFCAHSGIFFHRHCASGVKVSSGWIGRTIFLFQPNNDYTVRIKRQTRLFPIIPAPAFTVKEKKGRPEKLGIRTFIPRNLRSKNAYIQVYFGLKFL